MPIPPQLHVVDDPGPDGDEPIVVIVHGAMDRSASFGRVAKQLKDLHIVRYDRRGYGRSVEAGVGDVDDHVADLLGVIGDRRVTVFGHSMGAVIALVAAEIAPDRVGSVLAYEAPSPWTDWWPHAPVEPGTSAEDEAEAFMRRAIGDHFWSRLPARTKADRRAEGMALRADLASLRGDPPYDPTAITVPVIAAAGSETTWWHVRATQELADQVAGAEHAVLAGAEHGAHLTHPAAVAHLVRRAVERLT